MLSYFQKFEIKSNFQCFAKSNDIAFFFFFLNGENDFYLFLDPFFIFLADLLKKMLYFFENGSSMRILKRSRFLSSYFYPKYVNCPDNCYKRV